MEFNRWSRPLTYIIFMAVNIFYSTYLGANYSFSSHFDGSKTQLHRSVPETEVEKSLNQCVRDLCSRLDPQKTYKFYSDQAAIAASKSPFFESEILPIMREQLSVGKSLFDQAVRFKNKIGSIEQEVALSNEQRMILAYARAIKLLELPGKLPVKEDMIEMGPIGLPYDFSYYLSKEFDSKRFQSLVEHGTFRPQDEEIIRNYIERRNLTYAYPFIADPGSEFSNLIDSHGKGAESLIQNALARISSFYRNSGQFPIPSYAFFSESSLHKMSQFVGENFETLLKMKNISDYPYHFSQIILTQETWMEFFRTSQHLINPDLFEVPTTLPIEDIDLVKSRLKGHLETQKEFLVEENFISHVSGQCQWKINYLYEALPTHENLKSAETQVTQSIVRFQSWMFENLSPQTATSIFDFLRSWNFYYPPTKDQFAEFLKNFLRADRQSWYLSEHPEEIPTIVNILANNEDQWPSSYHGLENIETFCKSLKIRPIGDNTDASRGLVFLGWMTMKDQSLLETVVWHELGHIVSALIKGEYKYNVTPFLTNNFKHFDVSLDSFTKFASSYQCLGANQEQKKSYKVIGDPYLTWFNQGLLEQFSVGAPLNFQHSDIPGPEFKIGDMGEHTIAAGNFQSDLLPFTGISNIFERKALGIVHGEFVDEDWADLIAGQLSKDKDNPFCFILKEQDHLFWHEEKGLKNSEIQWINEWEEQRELIEANLEEGQTFPEFTEADREFYNAHEPKHSTLFYRFLHVETVRSGILPPSCQKAKKLRKDYSDIKKCDYF